MSILLTTTCNTFIILKLQIMKKKIFENSKNAGRRHFFPCTKRIAHHFPVSKKVSFQVRVTVWW